MQTEVDFFSLKIYGILFYSSKNCVEISLKRFWTNTSLLATLIHELN